VVTVASRSTGARGPGAERPRRPRPVRLLRWSGIAAVALLAAVAVLFAVAWATTPGVDDARRRVDALLAAHDATPLRGALPDRVVAALLATEDSRFEDHSLGLDWRGVLRAPLGLVAGRDLAGSTLEQQLAKNLYEDGAEDPVAKARSVALAVKLDTTWSKAQVLRMYLDAGYYGHGFWGVTDAAEGYFGAAPADLSWAQATVLAGLFQAPTAYDPFLHPERAAARQAHVLDRLVAVGTLTRSEADAVAEQPWGLPG
jgi:membrane peptidoglycan carboxypeptidase